MKRIYFIIVIFIISLNCFSQENINETSFVKIKNGTETIEFKTEKDLIDFVNEKKQLELFSKQLKNELENDIFLLKNKDMEIQSLYQFLSQIAQLYKSINNENVDENLKNIKYISLIKSINDQIFNILLASTRRK